MSDVVVFCPFCRADYRIDSAMLGKRALCQKCAATFDLVPATGPDTQTARLGAESRTGEFSLRKDGFATVAPPPPVDSPRVWQVGEVLLGLYEVRPLSPTLPHAEGGMGLVHRVLHRGWNMELAVKSPKLETFQSELGKQSFERECQTWIELGMHPNIVTCYLVRWLDGAPRVFAEFVSEGSLRDWIRDKRLYQGGPHTALRRILDVAIQFAWGLDYAHRRGVIHLDVKPANVMMRGTVAKVTDFGLARAQAVAETRGTRPLRLSATITSDDDSGVRWEGMTPAYCSPEQRIASQQHEAGVPESEQVKLTRATDIWSWALSVLTMFHGKAPCRQGGHTAHRVFEIFLTRQKESGRPPIPATMVEIMRRCFQVRPEDRPSDLGAVADQLAAVYHETFGEAYPRPRPVDTEWTADSLNNRAASLLDLGKHDDARQLLDQAWELRPWHPRVTFNRAMVAWRAGRMTDLEVVPHLQELCKTRPDDATTHYALGLARMERGDMKAAVETLESGLALLRSSPDGGSRWPTASRTLGEEIESTLETARRYAEETPYCIAALYAAEDARHREQPPTVFVDREGELLLFLGNEGLLEARETQTGRMRFAFQPTDSKDAGALLSTDLLWEARRTPNAPDGLDLCEVATGRVLYRCRPVGWGRDSESRSGDGVWRLIVHRDRTMTVSAASGPSPSSVLRGHLAPITAARLSHDGRWVISGSSDLTVRIWEVATGRCVRTLTGHNHSIDGVYLDPGGRWALSISGQRGLRLWDVGVVCRPDRAWRAPLLLSHVTSCEEAEHAQRRFTAVINQARASAERGDLHETLALLRQSRDLPAHEALRRSVSPWRLAGQYGIRSESLDACCLQTFDGDGGAVHAAQLTPDARWFVSGGWDGRLRVWHAASGRCLRALNGHTDRVRAVAVTTDQLHIVSAGWDRTLRLWEVATGNCVHVFEGHTKQINALALGLEGRLAVSGGWDGTIRLWDLHSRQPGRVIRAHDAYINAVAISLDGRRVLSGGDDQLVRCWDAATGQMLCQLGEHQKPVLGLAIRPDGQMAASAGADATISLWSLETMTSLGKLEGHASAVTAVAFTPDGRWLLSGSRDRAIRLWHIETRQCRRTMEGHADKVTGVSISDTGQYALSASEDETVRLWELEWDYTFPGWTDWDEAARPHLDMFLAFHEARNGRESPWTDADFESLITRLRCRGLGYIRPEGIRRCLQQMWDERNTIR